jgi:hypothetical protein
VMYARFLNLEMIDKMALSVRSLLIAFYHQVVILR